MNITNIELNDAKYNNFSDIFSAAVRMTVDNIFIIDGIRATYSDENPEQNDVTCPDGFHFIDDVRQQQIKEQVLAAVAQSAKQHDKKIIHDVVKKFLKSSNYKK